MGGGNRGNLTPVSYTHLTTWLDISHQIDLLELLSELNREKGYTLAAVLHLSLIHI